MERLGREGTAGRVRMPIGSQASAGPVDTSGLTTANRSAGSAALKAGNWHRIVQTPVWPFHAFPPAKFGQDLSTVFYF